MKPEGWVNGWSRGAVAAAALVASFSLGGGFLAGVVLVPLMGFMVRDAAVGWRIAYAFLAGVLTAQIAGLVMFELSGAATVQWGVGLVVGVAVAVAVWRLGGELHPAGSRGGLSKV